MNGARLMLAGSSGAPGTRSDSVEIQSAPVVLRSGTAASLRFTGLSVWSKRFAHCCSMPATSGVKTPEVLELFGTAEAVP